MTDGVTPLSSVSFSVRLVPSGLVLFAIDRETIERQEGDWGFAVEV